MPNEVFEPCTVRVAVKPSGSTGIRIGKTNAAVALAGDRGGLAEVCLDLRGLDKLCSTITPP